MKKLLLAFVAVLLAGSVCFAQEEAAKKGAEPMTTIGKVVSVTVVDPAKGITSAVVDVADDMGKTTKFTVDSSVKVVGKTLDAITLDQLKIGDKIEVKHSQDKAEAIKVAE